MSVWAAVEGKQGDVPDAVRDVLAALLETGWLRGVLVMMATRDGRSVQPALVTQVDRLRDADPFLPVMPIHMSRMASLVSVHGGGGGPAKRKIGIVARPCELRGLIELAKLNQLRADDFFTIGIDCVGTLEAAGWNRWIEADPDARGQYENALREGSTEEPTEGYRHACTLCETPVPWSADLSIHVIGVGRGILLEARDAECLPPSLTAGEDLPGRTELVERLIARRRDTRREALDAMQVRMQASADGVPGLLVEFETCQRCHNCTVACPICYCKECLFRTDTFQHEPRRYFGWADRKGAARLPGDAVTFQLTRLCHVTTSCVGCGMCTSACPADLPVDLLFQTVARRTQAMFDYVAGRSLDDVLPPATFDRKEFVDLGEVHR
jgi:formate dehydrogenase subunit beta